MDLGDYVAVLNADGDVALTGTIYGYDLDTDRPLIRDDSGYEFDGGFAPSAIVGLAR